MSSQRLDKLHKIESELIPMITESDLENKAEGLLKALTKLVHLDDMKATNAVILETVLFLQELRQEGEFFLEYDNKQS